jgi:hypothetical protein
MYVKATEDYGFHYKRVVEENFGPEDGLRYPRDVRNIEVYSDASFAPSAEQYKECRALWSQSLAAQ